MFDNPFLLLLAVGILMCVGCLAYEGIRQWRLRRQFAKLTGELGRLQGELGEARAELEARRRAEAGAGS